MLAFPSAEVRREALGEPEVRSRIAVFRRINSPLPYPLGYIPKGLEVGPRRGW